MNIKERLAKLIGEDFHIRIGDEDLKIRWENTLGFESTLINVGKEFRINELSKYDQRYILIIKEKKSDSGLIYNNVKDYTNYINGILKRDSNDLGQSDYLTKVEYIYVIDRERLELINAFESLKEGKYHICVELRKAFNI